MLSGGLKSSEFSWAGDFLADEDEGVLPADVSVGEMSGAIIIIFHFSFDKGIFYICFKKAFELANMFKYKEKLKLRRPGIEEVVAEAVPDAAATAAERRVSGLEGSPSADKKHEHYLILPGFKTAT